MEENSIINKWRYKKIPKIMFTYWYGPMSYLHYLSIKSFIDLNPDWNVQLYYPKYPHTLKISWTTNQNSIEYTKIDWYDKVKNLNIEFIPVDFDTIGFSNKCNEIIKSDYLRLHILSTQGGLWSDTDILYFKSMSSILLDEHLISGDKNKIDTVISYHDIYNYYSIGFLLSSANNEFFDYLLQQIKYNLDEKSYESIGSFLYKKLFNTPKDIQKINFQT